MALLLVFFVLFFSLVRPLKDGEQAVTISHRLTAEIDRNTIERLDAEEKKQGILKRLLSASPAWAEGLVVKEAEIRRRALDCLSRSLLQDNSQGPTPAEDARPLIWLNSLITPEKKPAQAEEAPSGSPDSAGPKDRLLEQLEEFTASLPELGMNLRADERSVILEVADRVTFEQGRADIKPQFRNMLIKLSKTLKHGVSLSRVRIKGHTDSVPISNPIYPSNWELSAARVARLMN